MMVSLDGYIEGFNHDLSWHNVDEEFNKFAAEQLDEADTLFFGRKTYELMANFWPTTQAIKNDPVVAEKINFAPKIVFSKTLEKLKEKPNWKNIKLIKRNLAEEIQKLKDKPGKDIAVLASNNLCVSLLELGLLDELRIMVNPVALGKGTPLFYGIKKKLMFKLIKTKNFKSGNILLYYKPIK
jgi:dihydrofolate reductase